MYHTILLYNIIAYTIPLGAWARRRPQSALGARKHGCLKQSLDKPSKIHVFVSRLLVRIRWVNRFLVWDRFIANGWVSRFIVNGWVSRFIANRWVSGFLVWAAPHHPPRRAPAPRTPQGGIGDWKMAPKLGSASSETRVRSASYAGGIEILPRSSNQGPDFTSHLPPSQGGLPPPGRRKRLRVADFPLTWDFLL